MLKELKEFFESIPLEGIHSIVLFGSYARGDERESSDVDILIISERKIENINEILEEFFKRFGRVLSVVNLTKREFIKKIFEGNSQLLIIFLEGKVIYDDGTFRRGKNLYSALHRKENWIVKYGGRIWSPKMLNTRWTF